MQCSFQEKEALADIFAQVKDVDEQIFDDILEILRKEKLKIALVYSNDFSSEKK
ncbi:unnamed protein product [Paramecium primaurelia]|uniref:Uncharacterized protein n=1 Tax=Paramecium primaurelia TaxID=5886 RepID=A0A8S1QT59_PARPR|nr:unnamed protein product [Paramecium primaurelia]